MQIKKISIYSCMHTHACAMERTVPTTLTIIKYPRSFLQLQKLDEVVCYILSFFNVSAKINDAVALTGINSWKAFSPSNSATACHLSEKKISFWEIMEPRFCLLQNTSHVAFSVKTDYGLLGKGSQQVLWEATIRIQDSPPVFERWKNNKGNYD